MSYLRRKGRSPVRPRLEQLERRDAPAVLTPTTFANAGISFNSATRTVEGGLYSLAVQESNQPISTVARYVGFLGDVSDTIKAERAIGGDLHNVSAATNANLNTILNQITIAVTNAPASVTDAAAETALHNAQTHILNIVNGDAFLKNLASMTATLHYNGVGFQQVPQKLPAGVTAANAPHENLAQIGAIFNDAANRFIGGVGSAANKAAIIGDMQAVSADLQDLEADHPELFGGLTGIHANTIVVQIPGIFGFINDIGINPVANRGNNDIMLDLIDIVQGDVNLANMANQGGIAGFAVFPEPRTPPTPYADNTDQKNFFATAISQGNTLGTQAINLIANHPEDTAGINALIEQFQDLGQFVNNFNAAQGGIFEARFDNELKAATGTQGAAITAMIKGLQTEDLALVTAAREGISGNFADVAGNNRWITVENGVTMYHHYNPDGTTPDNNPVTGVLNQPGSPNPLP
jgi:hypothetical protein